MSADYSEAVYGIKKALYCICAELSEANRLKRIELAILHSMSTSDAFISGCTQSTTLADWEMNVMYEAWEGD